MSNHIPAHYIEVHMKNGDVYYYMKSTTNLQRYADFVKRFFEGTSHDLNDLYKNLDTRDYFQAAYKISDISHLLMRGIYVESDGQGGYIATIEE